MTRLPLGLTKIPQPETKVLINLIHLIIIINNIFITLFDKQLTIYIYIYIYITLYSPPFFRL